MFVRYAMMFPLSQVGVRVFINPGSLALGSQLTVICRVRHSWIQRWSMVGVLISMCLIMAGSIGADVMITDPTAPSDVQRGWDESRLLRECERAKREKHVLNGATMIPLVVTTFG